MDGHLAVSRVGVVVKTESPACPYHLVDPDGVTVGVVTAWVRDLVLGDQSDRTVRAYCYRLLAWFRILWMLEVGWQEATEGEVAVLVGYLRSTPNPQRRATSASGTSVHPKTGKRGLSAGYAPATINQSLAAVHHFYAFHAHFGRGPVVNPVPGSPQRRRALAHRSPIEPAQTFRRARLRQKTPTTSPRCIPDHLWEELFAAMGSDRDRALLACFVSSGARAAELLGALVDDVDWPEQRIWVVSKGSRARRPVPISPEAVFWLSRYLTGDVALAPGMPLWRTQRGSQRQLTYAAMRRVLQRANDRLGTDWTLHDFRHTAGVRMANDGSLTLPEVQAILGHADLRTTSRYTVPRVEDLFDKLQDFYSQPRPEPSVTAAGYAPEDFQVVFGG